MDIRKVGVVGCGVMGSGIAQACAQSGYEVVAMEKDPAFLKKGLLAIEAFLKKGIAKGKVTEEEKTSILKRIKGTTACEDFNDCELVIEAVVEDLNLKKAIFASLDKVCAGHTIFASNTSSLSIIDLAKATKREEQFLGLHFFNPVPLMRLIEVVTSLVTSAETLEIGKAFGKSLGKTVIVAKDTPGFIVNYLQLPFRLNAIRMLEAGMATKEDIDAAATLGLGHPMGPLTLQDLVGLDVTYAAALSIYEATRDPVFSPPVLMQKMIAAGLLGRKTGKGFYKYKKK